MKTIKERLQEDLLIQADLYRIVALGFDDMDMENQSIFFDNVEDFLSNDFENIEVVQKGFYQREIELLKTLFNYKEESLEFEYHKLFDIQNGIPYSEASFVGIEKGNVIGDVAGFYKAVHYPFLNEGYGSPDSIKMETGFISFLFLKEFQLLQENFSEEEKQEKREIIKDLRYQFFSEHYLKWVPQFLETLFSSTEHPFYIHLGLVLQKLIEKIH